MNCFIYKSRVKSDTYLFLREKDGFDVLPEPLAKALGRLEWVMDLELNPDSKLAQANAKTVINTLASSGYYLQLPPNSYKNTL